MPNLLSSGLLASCALLTAVSACGSVTPGGLVAASRLDPLNTPPSQIALAVGVPRALRLADGDAEFRIAFRGGTAASTILLEEVAPLDLSASDPAGPRPNAPDETVYVARIAPEDAPRIAALQREIRNQRAAGASGEGSLTVRVVGGCLDGTPPEGIAVSTWLRTDPSDGFVPLTRREDLARALGAQQAALLQSAQQPCAAEE